MMDKGLGRLPPADMIHEDKYQFRLLTPVPTAERTLRLPYQYRARMDQGQEGACVGYALSWAMSILNRRYYDARELYRAAQRHDEWEGDADGETGPKYEGTSVRAGCDVLRDMGHRHLYRNHSRDWDLHHGIERNEWARTAEEVRACIARGVPVVLGIDWTTNFSNPVQKGREWWIGEGDLGRVQGGHAICAYAVSDRRQAIRLVNSWGLEYELVWMPYDTLQRVLDGLRHQGEATIITDRDGPQ